MHTVAFSALALYLGGQEDPMAAKPHAAAAPHDPPPPRTAGRGEAHARKGPRGRGAMRDVPLAIDPRIDLTKPIYEQVLALEAADEAAAERGRDRRSA